MLEFMKSLKFFELTVPDYLMRLSRQLSVMHELLLLLITQLQQFYRIFFFVRTLEHGIICSCNE